ncbi:MAG: aminotransferase class I/II-fold pyridoxal phosphate-dependent enzyme [Vicinamibacterales bacterium]
MLNRRAFVQSLGVGTAGSLTLLQAELRGQTTGVQERAARPATPPGAIRIGSNENPYGPTPAAIEAARTAIAEGHRYGGGASGMLVAALAKSHGVPPGQIMMSGGSGDVLRSTIQAFTDKTKGLVSGSPSYEQPVRQAKQAGVPVFEVPLTTDLKLDLPAMLAKTPGTGLLYLCNPNNPTSTIVPVKDVIEVIESVSKASPGTYVLVDEAYFEYAEDPAFGTVIPLIAKYPQLVVARTFSKIHGMAGMRVGYAVAQEKTLATIRQFHSSSGMGIMSVSAAVASFADTATLQQNQLLNRQTRAFTTAAFTKAGYTVAASQANFVLVDVRRDVKSFIEGCRLKGVVIGRPFPPLDTWARITIGTQPEMERAMDVFMSTLATAPTAVAGIHPSLTAYWSC